MKSDGIDLIDNSKISREFIDTRGESFPDSPSHGDIFQLTQTVEDKSPGIYVYSSNEQDWLIQDDEENNPYDIGVSIIGRPKPSDIVATHIAVRTCTLYPNFEKSRAVAIDQASDDTIFSVSVIDDEGNPIKTLGTITFALGSKSGVFEPEISGEKMIIQKGDLLSVKAPEIRDATLKNISITFAGQLATIND